MATTPQLRVLFFDVFGTCVEQRAPIADALSKATEDALDPDQSSINSEIGSKAIEMSYDKWFEFAGEWNKDIDKFTHEMRDRTDNVDWRAVDRYRLQSLQKLLAQRGLVNLIEDTSSSELHVKEGSLWNESQLKHLSLVWHRLTPWPDTCPGLDLLNQKFSTVTLSNTYKDLMESLVAHSSIPFKQVYTADMFNSYKPNAKVYLGAAKKMGVKPEECALVAAHLNDLKGAKACGFYAIYVERPMEEKTPELRTENLPDLVIKEDEDGFIALAKRLGVEAD